MSTPLGAAGLSYSQPDGTPLFSALTFHLEPGRTGLVGRNGVGKTTLLDLLAGVRTPTHGRVLRAGRVAYLPQAVALDPEASVAGALGVAEPWAALDRIAREEGTLADFDLVAMHWDLPDRVEAALARVGVGHLTPERALGTLSGGEAMRVRLAALLLGEPDTLLLDEPTNHLDADARRFVHDLVATWPKGLLLASHDRALLEAVDRVAELTPAGLRLYGGGFAFYQEQRQTEHEAAHAAAAEAEKQLREAERAAREARERQGRRATSGLKQGRRTGVGKMAAGINKRAAENTAGRLGGRHERIVEQAEGQAAAARSRRPEDRQIHVDLARGGVPAGKRIVEATDLGYRYPDAGADVWPEPLSFRVVGGERVVISGPNGSGKTTLVGLLCGGLTPTAGTLYVGTDRVAVLDQHVALLDGGATLLENLQRVAPTRPEHELRILLGRFLFDSEAVFKPAGVLSGGERLRAGLACVLAADEAPELLILDEPTNNLDLAGLEEVASALKRYRGALVVISHDGAFLDDVGAGRKIELTRCYEQWEFGAVGDHVFRQGSDDQRDLVMERPAPGHGPPLRWGPSVSARGTE
ncbi:MAG TPA: ABC-F family ATP-binding cassette domain-containing protein [Rubricoccaceae bacterium]|jgi:ATPase subunit of ABC transporter with duplicated ATPase domains